MHQTLGSSPAAPPPTKKEKVEYKSTKHNYYVLFDSHDDNL
jgi:hypothetical protein